jgi:hypothetical protein
MAGAMVFAVAFAAAATLSVNGGVLQAGEDTNLTCTATANVQGWGLETDTGLVDSVRVAYSPDCVGSDMFVIITTNGTPVADAVKTLDNTGSTGSMKLTDMGVGNVGLHPVLASAITDIEVYIEGPGT